MSGVFGSGPETEVPYGHVDVIVPFKVPETYDISQRRQVEKTVGALAQIKGIRNSLTEDVADRPGSYQLRLIGPEDDVRNYIEQLHRLSFD